MAEGESRRGWSWLSPIVAAVIGGAATIGAVLIANGPQAISGKPSAASTVTVTPRPSVTVTVTAPAAQNAPGPIQIGSCTVSQQCKAWNLTVRLSPNNGSTGIDFTKGIVSINGTGDLLYEKSADGTPELMNYVAQAYSTAVTSQNAGRQACMNSTESAPDSNAILALHKGLVFCVATGYNSRGIALVEETQPLGSNGILYLQEFYWPNSTTG
jgi:hypothetical protein